MHAGSDTLAAYRCEAATVAGFIQQLAVACVARGYWFYVMGCIPPHKDARAVDAKLIDRYGIDCSKWVRSRRKERGLGNIQYVRFRRFFVLVATAGEQDFFRFEARIRDIRRNPIHCFGYTVGCYGKREVGWHPSVRIERLFFEEMKEKFIHAAVRETSESLSSRFGSLPFEPYAPVRRQLLTLLACVNRVRLRAGMEPIAVTAVRLRRKPVRPFAPATAANGVR